MKIRKLTAIASSVLTLVSVTTNAAELNKSQVSKQFQELTPLKVLSVEDAPLSGFYQLVTERGVFYCVFRGHPDTHFGMIRPVVSVSSGHPFRCEPDSRFGVVRPPISV